MNDPDLLQKLNAYCMELIGETPSPKKLKNRKKNKKNKFKDDASKSTVKKQPHRRVEDEKNVLEPKNESFIKKTDDGFKVISEIPPDDSDFSDAFYSDMEETAEKDTVYQSNINKTDDGFKIISDIPSDDSDVSDAFENDLDESEWLSEVQERLKKETHSNMKNSNPNSDSIPKPHKNVEQSKLNSIKKPLLKLIEDFDLQDRVFRNEQSELCLKGGGSSTTAPKKRKCLSNEELIITDYSSRKKKKKEKEKPPQDAASKDVASKDPQIAKRDTEEAFKKARFEIFKFGLSGFKKEERKNAKIELAIKLGAKQPKNKPTNYKKLIEEKKLEKQKEVARRVEEREAGLPAANKATKERRKRNDVNPTNINPPVGKFKDGVLTISKKDLHKMSVQR